jgi:hypothetical protein
MHCPELAVVALCLLAWLNAYSDATIHLPMSRRAGRFVNNSPANLTQLVNVLAESEDRYARTQRLPVDNHLERSWSAIDGAVDDEHLVGSTGQDGAW